MKIIKCLLIFLFYWYKVDGKDLPKIHFTIENGLPSNTIYDIYRDDNGFLWFATNKGVSIYNGTTFKNYSTANGLADNTIYYFQKDYFGRIWLGTENGELCYYQNGQFFNKKSKTFLKLPFKSSITEYITLEKDSSITIYFSDRTKFINLKDERVKIISLQKLPSDFKSFNLKHIAKINSNLYELIHEEKTIYVDSFGYQVRNIVFKNRIRYHKSREQEFFIHSNAVWNRKGSLFPLPKTLENVEANAFYRIYYDQKNYFIGSNLGFYVNGNKDLLANERVSSIAKDIDSNYIIATLDNGVFFLNKNIKKTSPYLIHTNYSILQTQSSQNKVFFATTDKQIFTIDNLSKPSKIFDFRGDLKLKYQHLNIATYLSDSIIYLIFGFKAFQINVNKTTKIVAKNCNVYNPRKLILFNNLFLIHSASNILYFSGEVFKSKSDTINFKQYAYENKKLLNSIVYMTQAFDGQVWFATNNSIYKINNQFKIEEQKQLAISGLQYFEVFENNIIGINNHGQLISFLDFKNIHPQIDTFKNTDFIWDKIYPINSNQAILTTNHFHRLITFDNKNKKTQVDIIENALIPRQIDHIASVNGFIYFFRNEKVIVIEAKDLSKQAVKPIVKISSVSANKKQFSSNTTLINLNYNESKNLKIEFEAATVTGTEIFYEYSIENLNENRKALNWNNLPNPEIFLYSLPFGSFKIHVRAKTHSSQYSTPKFILIKIEPPFWAKWWFIVLGSIFILAISSFIVFKRIESVLKKKEIQHNIEIKLLKTEYKSLNALINPHFIFNALNSVQALIQKNELISSNRYMKILSDLIRQNMINVSKELIPLKKEIELIENYLALEKLRFKDKLHFKISIDNEIDLEEIFIPPLLVQPLVENAVKHGIFNKNSIDGLINIYVEQNLNSITIKVIDNGLGFEHTSTTENGHESYGLSNIQSRLLHLNKIYDIQMQFNIEEIKDQNNNILGVCSTIIIVQKD